MPQVSISVNGRDYRITCGAGEEEHVLALAALLDGKARDLTKRLGHISEGMALVMVGLTLADDLAEARRQRDDLAAHHDTAATAAEAAESRERDQAAAEEQAAQAIVAMAQRIESLAERLERT
ncbi:cell division protein ZapA [Roseospira navarrensis]|uniref:Cell division protein ZapA n=1 Tax=Roseospira navarrensis TaxID=140058 RepID=A0A7X2D5M7_9PROT|nr:cell division protein ZapA [Roseospira navarrensis]MQX37390.1 cell division protein ZapA [Roseospira navarrensis]